jgi:hypothetical protein
MSIVKGLVSSLKNENIGIRQIRIVFLVVTAILTPYISGPVMMRNCGRVYRL